MNAPFVIPRLRQLRAKDKVCLNIIAGADGDASTFKIATGYREQLKCDIAIDAIYMRLRRLEGMGYIKRVEGKKKTKTKPYLCFALTVTGKEQIENPISVSAE
jgi:hypothetical protein